MNRQVYLDKYPEHEKLLKGALDWLERQKMPENFDYDKFVDALISRAKRNDNL